MKSEPLFKNPFYQNVHDEIYKEKRDCLVIIVGGRGKGKSTVGCALCSAVDTTFNWNTVYSRVIHRSKQFLELIKQESNLERGNAIMFDEAGVGMGNREWYSYMNKAVSKMIQVLRFRGFLIVFTVPSMSFVDIHLRKMASFIITAKDIDFNSRRNIVMIQENQHNPTIDKTYVKYNRYRFGNRWCKFKIYKLRPPEIKLMNAYEKMADTFKQEIMDDLNKDLTKIEKKDKEKKMADAEMIDIMMTSDLREYLNSSGILDADMIASHFGLGKDKSRRLKKMVERDYGRLKFTDERLAYPILLKESTDKRSIYPCADIKFPALPKKINLPSRDKTVVLSSKESDNKVVEPKVDDNNNNSKPEDPNPMPIPSPEKPLKSFSLDRLEGDEGNADS